MKLDRKGLDDKVKPRSREREIWSAVAGVVLIAAACTALIVGVSAVTDTGSPAEAAVSANRFTHCSSQFGPNCVLDGDTFYMAGEKVEIPTIDAPEIHGAGCTEESRRGIQAAIKLHELLNGGTVSVTTDATELDPDGEPLRKVEVDGRNIGVAMVSAGLARTYSGGERRSWCS